MKNVATILLSVGVLFVGFALLTPLLFFLIGLLLNKIGDTSVLLQMEYALISFIGLAMLVTGSIFSAKFLIPTIASFAVATLAIAVSFVANSPKGIFDWIVIGCYYLSLFTALGMGIAILHIKHS